MFKILSLASDTMMAWQHQNGLRSGDKTFWAGTDIADYFGAFAKAGKPFMPPELMIANFSVLSALRKAIEQVPEISFLKKVQVIVIFGANAAHRPPQSEIADFNVVGGLAEADQWKPDSFRRIVHVFDIAQENTGPRGTVTEKAYRYALEHGRRPERTPRASWQGWYGLR